MSARRPGCALAALVVATGGALAVEAPSRLSDCDAAVRSAPAEYASYDCYRTLAREGHDWRGAIDRLEDLLAREPRNTLARVVLARIESDRGGARAEALFRTSADEFGAAAMPVGEVFARLDLAFLLRRQGRLDESAAEVERARRAAEASDVPLLRTNVRAEEAWIAEARADYVRAYERFREAERELFPRGPWLMQESVLGGLGSTLFAMGRNRESIEYYRRLAEARRARGDHYDEAGDLYSIALITSHLVKQGSASVDEQLRLEREALDAAVHTGNRRVESAVRQMIAEREDLDLDTRLRETERALALAEEVGDEGKALFSLRQLARLTTLRDPDHAERAYALAEEAVRRGRATGEPSILARGLVRRAQIRWLMGPRQLALDEAFEALDAIERIRDLQRDDLVRARLGSEWSFYYYLVSGAVLDGAGPDPSPRDLELAFNVVERLRGRVLLDALDAAGATSAVGGMGELRARRDAILEQIDRERIRLLDVQLPAVELGRLERLEAQEAELRNAIERSDPAFAALRRPALPTLEDVRRALGPDEAMLAFQVADRVSWVRRKTGLGGSFVFVITRDRVSVRRLPEEKVLAPRISLYLGFLDRRDGSDAGGSAGLYRDVLAEALQDVPAAVTRLVLVPDKALFRLPFDALKSAPEAPPLAARYEVSIAPSAGLWLRWRQAGDSRTTAAALVLADPVLPVPGATLVAGESERGLGLGLGQELGPLPHARREARAIVRALGGDTLAVLGADASEAYLATVDLRRFGVVHFAAHAMIDDVHPDRSALVLSGGLLHVREIVGLDLRGSVVVLSACRSSAGPLLDGEGPMSLARGFFQAGASAVVGSLWPLRDDEAASFVTPFYRHLGAGASVDEALARARRDAIDAGAPAASWAGWVLMGDGSVAPVHGAPARVTHVLPLVAVPALFAIAGLLVWRRFFRSR